MAKLTEGKTRGGTGSVKNSESTTRPIAPPPMASQTDRIEQLEKLANFLNEQLWYTQEAMRRMILELSNHLAPAGAEAIVDLMTEWTQIIHNINKDYKQDNDGTSGKI